MNAGGTSEGFADLAELIARADADASQARRDPLMIAAARRRRKRRRITGAAVGLLVIAAIGTYVPVTLLAEADTATVTVSPPVVTPPAAAALSLPGIGASAVSVIGAEGFEGTVGTVGTAGAVGSGGILASSGSADPLPIASITKLITAMVILEAKPLGEADEGPTITFSEADNDLYDKYYMLGATIQPMKTGSSMSERDALELMLGVSASNYAEAVSTWALGSQSGFLRAAGAWLEAQGLTSTTIVEPTGIDPRNISTTAELLVLGKLAMANPVIAAIVKEPLIEVPGGGSVISSNTLLGVEGVNGIKTGTLDEAGSCLLFSAVVDVGIAAPITIVGVVLGGASRGSVDGAVQDLIASIRAGFHEVPLIEKGQELGTYTTPWGDDAVVVAGAAASVLTWSDTPITSTVDTTPIASGSDGAEIGSVTFVSGNTTVTVPLLLDGSISGPDEWWRLTHPVELLGA